ncbi:uncharacterized protein VTP21DRAFT_95 [Calcarisporiella thermophila]|uniref:uncharacterized protein n=1 Tax=Calcarisporiella thermophila TaxID=911321 RepID=UPI00374378EC
MNTYKKEKEEWVTGHNGGPLWEISLVIATLLTSQLLWYSLYHRQHAPSSFFIEFLIFAIPQLLAQTILADHTLAINLSHILASGLVFALSTSSRAQAPKKESKRTDPSIGLRRDYISVYRAGMMLMTCAAILAVDFTIFPRRFAKTETWGVSLMDLGVGSFVFSSGVVSARVYLKPQSFGKRMWKAIQSGLALLGMGAARLAMVKGVEYQEHVTEYGVHWNFFFTLGFLPPFVTGFAAIRRYVRFAVVGLLVAVGYQYALSKGLQAFVLDAPRTDLISMNKEGICSFTGYLAIFLIALEVGTLVFENQGSGDLKPVWAMAVGLWILFGGSWRVLHIDISRRMANLSYVLCTAALNTTMILLFAQVERLSPHALQKTPRLLSALNANGLAVFLVANVMTGLVNFSIHTLRTPPLQAYWVLVGYLGAVCGLAWWWQQKGWRLRIG